VVVGWPPVGSLFGTKLDLISNPEQWQHDLKSFPQSLLERDALTVHLHVDYLHQVGVLWKIEKHATLMIIIPTTESVTCLPS